jgi:hypothetical protein
MAKRKTAYERWVEEQAYIQKCRLLKERDDLILRIITKLRILSTEALKEVSQLQDHLTTQLPDP